MVVQNEMNAELLTLTLDGLGLLVRALFKGTVKSGWKSESADATVRLVCGESSVEREGKGRVFHWGSTAVNLRPGGSFEISCAWIKVAWREGGI